MVLTAVTMSRCGDGMLSQTEGVDKTMCWDSPCESKCGGE